MKLSKREQVKLNKLQAICDKFNAAYPIGTEVLLKKDFQDELFPTKTRSTAQVMCGHSAVIWLENVSGCYLLDRVKPVVPTDIQRQILSLLESERLEASQRISHHKNHYWLPGYLIARRVKLSARHARAALIKLAAAGLVKRNEKYSGSNTTCWEITEFGSQALKGQQHDN